jgi:LmbE family N-acetylglucosaminyl deacetylase
VQKRAEAERAAEVIGAEVIFAPYGDGLIPDGEEARRFVAGVIREVRPTHVITHWGESIHPDHSATHRIVNDAVLLASLQDVGLSGSPLRGLRGIYYAENWEDAVGFKPYVYVDVGDAEDAWREAVTAYEFVRGEISSFHYLEYYQALHVLRGTEARFARAVAFDIAPSGKKRILEALP